MFYPLLYPIGNAGLFNRGKRQIKAESEIRGWLSLPRRILVGLREILAYNEIILRPNNVICDFISIVVEVEKQLGRFKVANYALYGQQRKCDLFYIYISKVKNK